MLGLGIYAAQAWFFSYAPVGFFGLVLAGHRLSLGDVGAGILFFASLAGCLWTCFVNQKASNFLIEVEIELRKVTWPAMKPWFSSRTEVWASTYVVLAVTGILTLFVYVVDRIFGFAWGKVFLGL
jgi:preprotein translocase SecE subunit